jgi:hypothetical protein
MAERVFMVARVRRDPPGSPRARRRTRGGVVVLLLAALLTTGVAPASGYWHSLGKGSGTTPTGTLLPPSAVLVPTIGVSAVSVKWHPPKDGVAPTGYYVMRIKVSDGKSSPACNSGKAALVAAVSCLDLVPPNGKFRYQVTAVFRSWTATSGLSDDLSVFTPDRLAFVAQPSTVAAGAAISPGVAVEVQSTDGSPVPIAGVAVTIALGTNPADGTLSGATTAYTGSSGVATFDSLSVDMAGSGYRLTATSANLTSATSAAFTVNPGSPAKLAFTASPAKSSAGHAFNTQPVVEILDEYGNLVTGSAATVSLALKNPGSAILTCSPRAASGGVATFTGCSIDSVGTYQLTAASGTLSTATSASFTIASLARGLAWSTPHTTRCIWESGSIFWAFYIDCRVFGVDGTFTSKVSLTDSYGDAVVNPGPDITVTVTGSNGVTVPTTLTIPHGASVSTTSTTFSPNLAYSLAETVVASAPSLWAAAATLTR